jgi:hypothetical protein
MKYARMKVQIIRNNPNTNNTTTNNEPNFQLADSIIVAKVSFYFRKKFLYELL